MGRPGKLAAMPTRIRLRRTKGWRLPESAVVAARPTRWGNPHRIGRGVVTRAEAVARFERQLLASRLACTVDNVRRELARRDLACWCPEDEPCHAEVLLRITNEPGP